MNSRNNFSKKVETELNRITCVRDLPRWKTKIIDQEQVTASITVAENLAREYYSIFKKMFKSAVNIKYGRALEEDLETKSPGYAIVNINVNQFIFEKLYELKAFKYAYPPRSCVETSFSLDCWIHERSSTGMISYSFIENGFRTGGRPFIEYIALANDFTLKLKCNSNVESKFSFESFIMWDRCHRSLDIRESFLIVRHDSADSLAKTLKKIAPYLCSPQIIHCLEFCAHTELPYKLPVTPYKLEGFGYTKAIIQEKIDKKLSDMTHRLKLFPPNHDELVKKTYEEFRYQTRSVLKKQ